MAEDNRQRQLLAGRGTLTRGRSTFVTRTATDEAGELLRRSSLPPEVGGRISEGPPASSFNPDPKSTAPRIFSQDGVAEEAHQAIGRVRSDPLPWLRRGKQEDPEAGSKPQSGPHVVVPLSLGGVKRLGTFSGVFVPTTLNVLSILMFIRFGFVLGQTGLLGMFGLLVAAYVINVVTTCSISAVASNGTVRGGGAYYLISRCLGPEFGGSIGLISYLGFVLNTAMNAVGLIDCLIYNFGSDSGIQSSFLPESAWWPYLWSTCVIVLCVAVSMRSAIFAKASNILLFVLMIATLSIPVSSLFRQPFKRAAGQRQFTEFTGMNLATLRSNLLPHFTRGAAGSQVRGKETWSDMFGILFPSCAGIYAGASMSSDLRNPSKSIPAGTLYGIAVTFLTYALVILALAASVSRATFYENVNVVQDINLSGGLVLLGELATTIFSVLMGLLGSAKQLQAIARDGVFPGLSTFSHGLSKSDDPVHAILLTWFLVQLSALFDVNNLASLVTMSYLLMNLALHLACLLLKVSSAPNFRPSFRFFNAYTAGAGALLSVLTMFFVDAAAASGSLALLFLLFVIIHYTTPPKAWGSDVTAGLVYHQVRKYLLRLKTESVKYWRPQILLFVNDPRRGYKLVSFANSLKKGGLLILGHVIVTDDFGRSVPEARKQKAAWTKYIDYVKIKAFVNVAVSPSIEWGARNLVLSAGLGGMRPNIVILGSFNLQQFRQEQPLVDIPEAPPDRVKVLRRRRKSSGLAAGALPTDTCYVEKRTDMQSYVLMLEDMLLKLQTNVAMATSFSDLEIPDGKEEVTKSYIDLWPIQMSAMSPNDQAEPQGIMTNNFDTYTLILQLGCILHHVPKYKKEYKLRVIVFVEFETDAEEEKERVTTLLSNLRISAEVLVFYLDDPKLGTYQYVVGGKEVDSDTENQVTQVLEDEEWWSELLEVRGKVRSGAISVNDAYSVFDDTAFAPSSMNIRSEGLRDLLRPPGRRQSISNLSNYASGPSMRTHHLDDDLLSRHASRGDSDHEYSDADSDVEYRYQDEEQDGTASYSDLVDSTQFEDGHMLAGDGARSLNHDPATGDGLQRDGLTTGPLIGSIEIDQASDQRTANDGIVNDRNVSLQSHNNPGDRNTSPSFSAAVLPPTQSPGPEGIGPSIMFEDIPHPRRATEPKSIYTRHHFDDSPTRSVATSQASSIPLSFNNLPCRAQHMILNELMAQNSDDTAVIFTTLPAPVEGTWKSESDSLRYLTDLEVLTQGLGPVLMIHSNSMTVTTNL